MHYNHFTTFAYCTSNKPWHERLYPIRNFLIIMVITCTTLIDNDCLPWNTFPARTKIINIELRGIKTVNYMREGLTILINMSTRNFWNIERVGFFGRGRDTADCDNIVFELNMGCLPRPLGDFSCRIGNPRQPGRFLQCKKTQIRHRICVPLLITPKMISTEK